MQETKVWSLVQEDPLEEEMATHSSILAWRIPWIEEHGRLQSMGSQRVGHDWMIEHTHVYLTYHSYLSTYLNYHLTLSICLSKRDRKQNRVSRREGTSVTCTWPQHPWLSVLGILTEYCHPRAQSKTDGEGLDHAQVKWWTQDAGDKVKE